MHAQRCSSATAACRRRSTSLRSRAEPLGIELRVGPMRRDDLRRSVFGVLLQYPDEAGGIDDLAPLIARAHEAGALVAVGTDLLALALVTPAGRDGRRRRVRQLAALRRAARLRRPARRVLRHAQRLRAPGAGPHHRRVGRRARPPRLPHGAGTREQHIRREKATSNICTAQALLANMAAMYAVYHGPDGLRAIATRVHALTRVLDVELRALGLIQTNPHYFDTLRVEMPSGVERVRAAALAAGINFRYVDSRTVGISLNETVDDRRRARRSSMSLPRHSVFRPPAQRLISIGWPSGWKVPTMLTRACLRHCDGERRF